MNANELAKYMRERALLIEGDEKLSETSLRSYAELSVAKKQKVQRLEELKKVYFNAGRWVGGARDYAARQAYEEMLGRENANR